ncbi:MAG TPA: A24 family peptidase [Casimicrobiaceae bacterium]|nr:A24 family peptidase [Casimicrobiaceae bacterium]
MPALATDPQTIAVVAGIIGLCVGSFVNVVIYRLPKMLDRGWRAQCAELAGESAAAPPPYNLVIPRSQCPSCGHPISAVENIPVLSYLVLRGRCRACKARISARYPLVELLTGLLAVAAALRFHGIPTIAAACVLLCALVALTFIDFDTQLLPDNITLPLVWAGLLVNTAGIMPGVSLRDAVLGAVAGYLALWVVYWLFKLIRGKEGMGYGDFKLLAALGAWLGWQMLPLIVLLSSLVGATIGIGLVVFKGRDHQVPLAFGPFLAIAGAIALFFGRPLMALYLPG